MTRMTSEGLFFGLTNWINFFFYFFFSPPPPTLFAPSLPDWNLAPLQISGCFFFPLSAGAAGTSGHIRSGTQGFCLTLLVKTFNLEICRFVFLKKRSAVVLRQPLRPPPDTSSWQGSQGGQRSPDSDLCCTPPPPLCQQRERERAHPFFLTLHFFFFLI